MSNICKCDICGQEKHHIYYSLHKTTLFYNYKLYDICEDCVKKIKEMKNEREKLDQHS